MKKCGLIPIIMVLITMCNLQPVFGGISPYPDSSFIAGITWDFNSHDERAGGSDIWAPTWADDGHQYAPWGDGNGFEGGSGCRVDGTGIGRIEGTYDSYTGYDRSGKNTEVCSADCAASTLLNRWGFNIASINGIFYMFTSSGSEGAALYYSTDHGCSWSSANCSLGANNTDKFRHATILNMGQDNGGARDNYIYVYGPEAAGSWSASCDSIVLARVPKTQITSRNAYEFYAGADAVGVPVWDSDINNRQPIFTWTGKVHWVVYPSYSPDLDRYFLCFNSDSFGSNGKLATFEGPNPWGPWYEVEVYSNWGGFGYTFSYSFAPKWWRNNGKDFTLVFSGTGGNDSWNTVNGSFILPLAALLILE